MTPASATTSDNMVTSRLAHIKSVLSGLVKNGTLTHAQADTLKSSLTERLTNQVNGFRAGGGMGRGSRGAGMAPSSGDTSDGTSSTPSSTT